MVEPDHCNQADVMFQGKHTDEVYQFHFHQHWIRMIWPIVKLLLWNTILFSLGWLVFGVMGVEDDTTRRGLLLILSLFFVLVHFEFITRLYRYYLYVVVVTDKKIHRIKKSLIFIDEHQSVDLWMLQDVFQQQHGLIQNIMAYGTIILEAQETVLRMHFVPSVRNNAHRIMHLREAARSRMNYGGLVRERAK